MVLEKILESPLDSKEIQPVNPKGNQPWIFIGRTDAEAEAPVLWPPDAVNQLIGKKPWCWKRLKAGGEGTTEDEMVGWHHWLNGHEFEQILGDGKGKWSRAGKLWLAAVHGVAESQPQLQLNNSQSIANHKNHKKTRVIHCTYNVKIIGNSLVNFCKRNTINEYPQKIILFHYPLQCRMKFI